MVQEVQTAVTQPQETTLETIQAIGTSSVKIREWRQTTARYTSNCISAGSIAWTWNVWDSRSYWPVSSNLSIWSMEGKQEFVGKNWWIRVPVAWTYQITLYWSGGSSLFDATIILKCWGNEVYTNTFNSNQSETVTMNVDLGKFDLVEVYWSLYCSSGSSASTTIFVRSLTIQQL